MPCSTSISHESILDSSQTARWQSDFYPYTAVPKTAAKPSSQRSFYDARELDDKSGTGKRNTCNQRTNGKPPSSLQAVGVFTEINAPIQKMENITMKSNNKSTDGQTGVIENALEPGVFDLEKLRLSQDFEQIVGVKKKIMTVPVRKPNRQEFVRTHPDEGFSFQTAILDIKEDREMFIVDPLLFAELSGEITPMVLVTTMSRQNVLTLWPIRMPDSSGRIDQWNHSALEAALLARENWLRVAANMHLGAYETFLATAELPEPEWPDLSFQEIITLAFKDRLITDLDHPAICKLKGEM